MGHRGQCDALMGLGFGHGLNADVDLDMDMDMDIVPVLRAKLHLALMMRTYVVILALRTVPVIHTVHSFQ